MSKTGRLLRLPEVRKVYPKSKSTIYAEIARGEFPAPVKIGRASAWFEDEIDAYLEKLRAERDGGAAEQETELDQSAERAGGTASELDDRGSREGATVEQLDARRSP